MTGLLGPGPLRIVSAGVPGLVPDHGADVTSLDWQPPVDGDPETLRLVVEAFGDHRIDQANAVALERALAVDPVVIGVLPASDAMPALDAMRLLLHAGPPIPWEQMCGPMRGALVGAVLFEEWADDPAAAERLLASGEVRTEPCHHYGSVGPMAGVVSRSMPVWVVADRSTGKRTYATLNEGLGAVLRFGAFGPAVLDRLHWMAEVLGPALNTAIESIDGIGAADIMAQALHMGDELHNRNVAATGQLIRRVAPALCATAEAAPAVLSFMAGNDHTFLNISMAASKLTMDAANDVPHSTIVTAMARNGIEFGVRMSGTGSAWFTAPAPMIEGLFFSGYGPGDAAADLGDSAITETAGLGGFAMGAAPAIVRFVGGTPDDALGHSRRMRDITASVHPSFTIPMLGFAGTAFGIDARAVVDTGITPVINTGIAHREPGVGQIGAGVTNAPWECFRDALLALRHDRAT
jgi:Protein of unknown function (DUF1116)